MFDPEELENSPEYARLSNSQIKKLKRAERKNKNRSKGSNGEASPKAVPMTLKSITPMTENQKLAFEYYGNKNLLLHGLPGTGKTFISLYLSLNDVLHQTNYEKIFIVRSAVASRDIGFLPGTREEKESVFEAPYVAICAELFNKANAYDTLKRDKVVEFMTTSFIRGLTLNNCVVIIDECQNLNAHELDSVITRLGDNSKLIISGDFRQSDFKYRDEKQGLIEFMNILDDMPSFAHVEFKVDDIVRGGLVREYIISKHKNGYI